MSDKKKLSDKEKTDDESGGAGSQSGEIGFTDFLLPAEDSRDHLLSAQDKKNFLQAHANQHLGLVKKQKDLARDRALLKSQDQRAIAAARNAAYQGPAGGGGKAEFKAIGILNESVQYTNMIDSKVNPNIAANEADTNSDKKELNLELQLKNQLRYSNTPTFNPKPRGPY